MARRIGMGKGQGKGYKNLMGRDKVVHSQSARGIKQPQKVPFPYTAEYIGMPIEPKEVNLRFIGEDDWGRKTYEDVKSKKIWKDVDGVLHSTTKDGEPEVSMRKDIKVNMFPSNTNVPIFITNEKLSEKEVNLLKRRLNDGKINRQEVFSIMESFKLTEEQENKAIKWLKNQWKSPKTGVERKNNPFGHREEYVLENFSHFELIDFYDNVNYTQAQAGIKNNVPMYRVYATDGSSFEYWVGYQDRNQKSPVNVWG